MGPVSLIGDVDLENLANIAGMEVPKRVVLLDNTDIYEVFLGKIIHIDLAAHEDEAGLLEDSRSLEELGRKAYVGNLVLIAP